MRNLAIITGADGGMGTHQTLALAKAGFRVIMACYDIKAAEPLRQRIASESGNEEVEVMSLNLADMSSVRNFAQKVVKRGQRVEILMCNAGCLETHCHSTTDGLEWTVSVNYVGHYLLTRLLLPLMGQGSRIVNMASCVYALGRLDFPEFFTQGRKGSFWRIPVYSNTKLAITLFTLDLARRVKSQGITVNAADPGVVNTGIIRMQMFFDPLTDLIFRPCIRTPRQGADTAIRLLLDNDKSGQTGTFCRSNRIVNIGEKYTNHKQMATLWDETEKIVKGFLS